LLVCRLCGYAYYGKSVSLSAGKGKRRDYAYYRCCGSDAYRFGGQRVCTNLQVRTDRLDEAVWQEVESVLRDPKSIAAEYERRLVAAQRSEASSDLTAVELQLAKLRRGMDRLIDSYAEGLIERREFEPRLAGFRQRIQEWETQASAMRDEAAQRRTLSLIIGRLEAFSDRVQNSLATADWQQRRELIRLLVKRVELDRQEVNVVFRVEPTHSPAGPNPADASGAILQDCRRGDHAALRCPAGSLDLRAILHAHWGSQPSFDVQDCPWARHVFPNCSQQKRVVDVVERDG
jgi:site-specific DNA recombinase